MDISAAKTVRLLLLLAVAGCATTRSGPAFEPAHDQELPILREVSGTYSTIGRPLRLVVHDPGTLAMLPIDLGPVDFNREMVLVSALGPTPSPTYAIRIRRIWRDGPALRAAMDIQYPAPDAQLRSAPASPYHAVVVPKSNLNVRNFQAGIPRSMVANRATAAGP